MHSHRSERGKTPQDESKASRPRNGVGIGLKPRNACVEGVPERCASRVGLSSGGSIRRRKGVQTLETAPKRLEPRPHYQLCRVNRERAVLLCGKDRRPVGRDNDYRSMTERGYPTSDTIEGRPVGFEEYEEDLDEGQQDDMQPGCLDVLGPQLKRLFGAGNRRPRKEVERLQLRPPQRASGYDQGERRMEDREVPLAYPHQRGTPPHHPLSDGLYRGRGLTSSQNRGQGGPTDGSSELRTSTLPNASSLVSPLDQIGREDIAAAPALFPTAHTGYINGGTFYMANSVTIVNNHVCPSHAPQTPVAPHSYRLREEPG